MRIEQRRQDLIGRIARATFPARESTVEFLAQFPCSLVGHAWVEVPHSLKSYDARISGRMQFKCKRCSMAPGFSN